MQQKGKNGSNFRKQLPAYITYLQKLQISSCPFFCFVSNKCQAQDPSQYWHSFKSNFLKRVYTFDLILFALTICSPSHMCAEPLRFIFIKKLSSGRLLCRKSLLFSPTLNRTSGVTATVFERQLLFIHQELSTVFTYIPVPSILNLYTLVQDQLFFLSLFPLAGTANNPGEETEEGMCSRS